MNKYLNGNKFRLIKIKTIEKNRAYGEKKIMNLFIIFSMVDIVSEFARSFVYKY